MTAELSDTAVKLRRLAEKLRTTTETSQPDLQASLASVRQTADHLARTSASLEQIVAGNEAQLSQFAGSGLNEIQQLVIDVRDTAAEIRALASSLHDDPSQLIRSPPPGGVELPR